MARKAANVSRNEFMQIWQSFIDTKFADYSVEQRKRIAFPQICEEVASINKDLQKVHFDFENWGFQDTNGESLGDFTPVLIGNLTCFNCYAGGDWEYPVSFVIYLDQDRKTFRAYIPKEGNAWNHDTKEAFGNGYNYDEIDNDVIFLKKWCKKNNIEIEIGDDYFESSDAEIMVNHEKMLKDIQERIQVEL